MGGLKFTAEQKKEWSRRKSGAKERAVQKN